MLSTYCVLGAVRGAANLTRREEARPCGGRAGGLPIRPEGTDQLCRQESRSIFVLLYVCLTLAALNFFPSATHPDNLIPGSQGAFCSWSPNAPARLVSKQVHPHLEGQLRPGPPTRLAPAAFLSQDQAVLRQE